MARKRMIDPEFWTDKRISQLTPIERLFFLGCISTADDEGRLIGDPAYLRSRIFPYDEITIEEVKKIRDRITQVIPGFVLYMDNEGEEYIAFKKWFTYQWPSYKKRSRLPLPPFAEIATPLQQNIAESATHPQRIRSETATNPQHSIGKVSIGKVSVDENRLGVQQNVAPTATSSPVEKSPERKKTISAFVKLYTASPPGVDPPYHLYPSEAILDDIDLLAELWGDDVVQEAIATAVAVGKVKVARAYLEAIILNWKEEGKVKPRLTKDEYRKLEEEKT